MPRSASFRRGGRPIAAAELGRHPASFGPLKISRQDQRGAGQAPGLIKSILTSRGDEGRRSSESGRSAHARSDLLTPWVSCPAFPPSVDMADTCLVREDVATVPLDGKQQTRIRNFFPPLLLLESIHQSCNQRTLPKAADTPPNPNQGPEEKFRTFVNKLAHICDYRPKGDTVTALAVLLDNGRVLYLFASNRRGRQNLIKTKADLTSLLNILKENLEAETRLPDRALADRLLRQVLLLNTVRVQGYLSALSTDLKSCINGCQGDTASLESRSTRLWRENRSVDNLCRQASRSGVRQTSADDPRNRPSGPEER